MTRKYLSTTDPEWLAHAAKYWERRYYEQHRTLHRLEDELAELRAAAREVILRLETGPGYRSPKQVTATVDLRDVLNRRRAA